MRIKNIWKTGLDITIVHPSLTWEQNETKTLDDIFIAEPLIRRHIKEGYLQIVDESGNPIEPPDYFKYCPIIKSDCRKNYCMAWGNSDCVIMEFLDKGVPK